MTIVATTEKVTGGDLKTAEDIVGRILQGKALDPKSLFPLLFQRDKLPLFAAIAEFVARERELTLKAVAAKLCIGCREGKELVLYQFQGEVRHVWCHPQEIQGNSYTHWPCQAGCVISVREEWETLHEHTSDCHLPRARGLGREIACGRRTGENLRTHMMTNSKKPT